MRPWSVCRRVRASIRVGGQLVTVSNQGLRDSEARMKAETGRCGERMGKGRRKGRLVDHYH